MSAAAAVVDRVQLALRRSGIVIDDTQRAEIEALANSGRGREAQQRVLALLEAAERRTVPVYAERVVELLAGSSGHMTASELAAAYGCTMAQMWNMLRCMRGFGLLVRRRRAGHYGQQPWEYAAAKKGGE